MLGSRRELAFAAVNVALVLALAYYLPARSAPSPLLPWWGLFAAYFAVISVAALLIRAWAEHDGLRGGVAFGFPIAALVLAKCSPLFGADASAFTQAAFIGLSYMAFRLSHLAMQVKGGVVPAPSYAGVIGFAFFAPTLQVGPISPYSLFVDRRERTRESVLRALFRIVVGVAKFSFLGVLVHQLSFEVLFVDGHPHGAVDFAVACVATYLYVYCNFSGYCDIAIGVSHVVGRSIQENFHNPFAARNVKDFWNRWHITLSEYLRDVVFSPLSVGLMRRFGPRHADHITAFTVLVVFLLVGVWHGTRLNFVMFGIAHALAIMANQYYSTYLKKALGKKRFKAYNESRAVRAVAVVLTFGYVSATFAIFANDWSRLTTMVGSLLGGRLVTPP